MAKPSSIFQDPPEDVDETWTHGAMMGSGFSCDDEMLARSYFAAATVLIAHVLSDHLEQGQDFLGPILFNYRHGIELYLKAIVKPGKRDHNLGSLLEGYCQHLREHYKEKPPKWVTLPISEFAQIDHGSGLFRYGDPNAPAMDFTHWIDFPALRRTMIYLEWAFRRTIYADANGLEHINATCPAPRIEEGDED